MESIDKWLWKISEVYDKYLRRSITEAWNNFSPSFMTDIKRSNITSRCYIPIREKLRRKKNLSVELGWLSWS